MQQVGIIGFHPHDLNISPPPIHMTKGITSNTFLDYFQDYLCIFTKKDHIRHFLHN